MNNQPNMRIFHMSKISQEWLKPPHGKVENPKLSNSLAFFKCGDVISTWI
jgi:hypothetical protein